MLYPRRSASNRPPPRYPRTVRHPRGTRPATGVRRRRSGPIPKVPPSVLTTRAAGRKLIPASRRGPFVPGIPTPKGKAAMPKKATKAQIRSNCENAKNPPPPSSPPSIQPSTTSKTRTTKHTQSLRTAVKSVSYNAVPIPPPAAPPRSQGEAWRPASVAPASKRPAASPGPTNHQSPRSRPASRQPPASASKRQNRTTKQTQSRRTHLHYQLADPRSPSTRSVDLGFEIRGFSHPRNHESSANPPRPHSPPACRQAPTPSQTAKIELPNEPISPNLIEISVLVSAHP